MQRQTVDITPIESMTPAAASDSRMKPSLLKFYSGWFEEGLPGAVETGSLLCLEWLIYRQEKLHPADRSERLPLAKAIEIRWRALEHEYGEGSLLDAESPSLKLITSEDDPDSVLIRKPHLLKNAQSLRELKGPHWWTREHRLDCLSEAVKSGTC